jgi:hypothetical protein
MTLLMMTSVALWSKSANWLAVQVSIFLFLICAFGYFTVFLTCEIVQNWLGNARLKLTLEEVVMAYFNTDMLNVINNCLHKHIYVFCTKNNLNKKWKFANFDSK